MERREGGGGRGARRGARRGEVREREVCQSLCLAEMFVCQFLGSLEMCLLGRMYLPVPDGPGNSHQEGYGGKAVSVETR